MSAKVYRSRFDLVLFWPHLSYAAIIILVAICANHWYILILIGMPVGALFGSYFTTQYKILETGILQITSQQLPGRRKNIYIRSISQIEQTRNKFSAPALSKNRLRITFDNSQTIYISPSEPGEFLKLLAGVNPQIKGIVSH